MTKRLKIPELDNPEWLAKQYETKSLNEIAGVFGVHTNSVRNRFVKYGIERRDKYDLIRDIGKKPKSASQRSKMSESAKIRWKDRPMTDETRLRVSQNRKRDGDKASPYKRVFDLEYGAIHEHRLIMIKHLGRPLKSNEHVHHIDGNPENNSLDNLIVLTNSEHAKLHRAMRGIDRLGRLT